MIGNFCKNSPKTPTLEPCKLATVLPEEFANRDRKRTYRNDRAILRSWRQSFLHMKWRFRKNSLPWKLSGRTCRDLQMRLNPRNGTARFLMSDDSESPMGQPQFEDWEAAKAKIREKLRWRSRSSMKPKRAWSMVSLLGTSRDRTWLVFPGFAVFGYWFPPSLRQRRLWKTRRN